MSAVAASVRAVRTETEPDSPRLVLLGTGTVGSAFVARWQQLVRHRPGLPQLIALANSRGGLACNSDALRALDIARSAPPSGFCRSGFSRELLSTGRIQQLATEVAPTVGSELPGGSVLSHLQAGDFVIDATASEAVAARHAAWLDAGVHVVTANKLGTGADAARAHAIAAAQRSGGTHYGDAATVGAGLPLLRSVRELVAGGDRIHAIEGVLSGSLAWLFAHFDDTRPFSDLVREAREAGYTEPDPRGDLSGEDVRRKLLILARAAGIAIDSDAVDVESLVPADLSPEADIDRALAALDAPIAERFRRAHRDGAVLRFVGRVDANGARVALLPLPRGHALCGGSGTDNRVAIFSDRYRVQPLVIQGPGAGAEITAAALIDDVLRIARLGS